MGVAQQRREPAILPRQVAITCWPWLLAAFAAMISLFRTGYNFNISNHNFDLPVVLRFSKLVQFNDDSFILSLHHFVSALYPLLSLITTEANVVQIFFVALFLTHLLTFLALLCIGESCGIRGWYEQAALIFILAALKPLYGISPVGADALLIPYFTHTEIARAVALFAIVALMQARLVWAAALIGLAFALNAFLGIWMLAPLGLYAFRCLAGGADLAARIRVVALAAIAFAVPAAPMAIWISMAALGSVVDFDYRAFLQDYYPYHFFLQASSWWNLSQLLFAILAGALASLIVDRGRDVQLVVGSLLAVFGFGILVGLFSHSRLLLNLHLLRVDGLVILLAATVFASAVVIQLRQARSAVNGPLLLSVFGMFCGLWPAATAGMMLAYTARVWPKKFNASDRLWQALKRPYFHPNVLLPSVILLAAAGSLYATHRRHMQPAGAPSDESLMGVYAPIHDWLEVQHWARAQTPASAMFLVPPKLDGFRTGAQRRIWVSDKDGAAAMWSPQTYDEWHQRREAVQHLDDVNSILAYACTNAIDYVVLDLRPRQGRPFDADKAVYLNTWFEVHQSGCDKVHHVAERD